MQETPAVVNAVELNDETRQALVGYTQEQHDQLEAYVVRLMVTYNFEGACIWLVGANKQLEGQSPIDILAGNDEEAKVRLNFLIEAMEAGNF